VIPDGPGGIGLDQSVELLDGIDGELVLIG
jgi:hypothetical protein